MPRDHLLRIDMHVHTHASWDCLSDPGKVLDRALDRGLDRIAITDHNRLWAAREMALRHPDRIIPGEEVKTAEGIDVIGLYLHEEIPKGTPGREVCARVREQGGLVYLPHPYARGKGGSGRYAEELAEHADIIEVFNARLHDGALNQAAADLAERRKLPGGGGSDAHSLWEVGRACVELPDHPNRPDAFLEALASARVSGVTSPHAVHLVSTFAKFARPMARPARTGRGAREG